jgi:WD40 repeat protein/serine/threonine protein kinase
MSDSDASAADPFGQIADEFVEAIRQGKRPTVEEFARRYPAHAEDIRDMLLALALMEQAKSPDHTSGEGANPAAPAAPPLRQLGDYQILREIGRGGMGVVYEAQQLSLGRHVAIKVLLASARLDPRHLGRFQREARSAAKLHHTNIVPVFGVGEQDGLHYYVMQFIRGLGLDVILDELRRLRQPHGKPAPTPGLAPGRPTNGSRNISAVAVAHGLLTGEFMASGEYPSPEPPLPPGADTPRSPDTSATIRLPGQKETSVLSESGSQYWQSVARIALQVADALTHAASQGVLHRDIKPSNLLLDDAGNVWVTDFGLAKADSDGDNLTRTGDIVGTLRYMAPERFNGQGDLRSDVYSLGLTLYELLTLRPAFDEGDRNKLVKQVMHDEPLRPRKVNPGVPRDLETVALKAIARDPAHRYQTPAEMADDLKRFVEDRPVKARRISGAERLWRWCRRNPARAGLVLALALLIVAVVTFSSLWAVREHQVAGSLAESNQNLVRAQGEREAALKQARQESARVALDRGLNLCEAGDVGLGLTYLTRALESAVKAEDVDLESAIRLNVAAWETQLWSLENYREAPPGARVSAVSLSPRGSLLAAALTNDTVELWDLRDGHEDQALHSLPHGEALKALAFSGDGGLLLMRSDRTVRVWDVATGRLAGPPLVHPNSLTAAALSRDGQWVLTGAGDPQILADNAKGGTTRLWQTKTGKCIASRPHKFRVSAVAFGPRDELALTGDALGVAQVWNLPSGDAVGPPLVHKSGVEAAVFSPDGARVLTGTSEGMVHLWQVETARPVFPPLPHGEWIKTVAFSADGRRFVVLTRITGQAHLWRADTGTPIASPLPHQGLVLSVAFSPDSRTLLTGGAGGLARGWDATRGQPTGPILAHQGAVTECAFGGDGQSVVTLDGAVRRWHAPSGLRRGPPLEHKDLVRAAAFSPDGRLLLTGGLDGVARLWDTALAAGPPRLLKPASAINAGINAVAFSPNGRLALTGGLDNEPSLWDVASGSHLTRFKGHTSPVYALTFSRDGKTALTGGADGTARLWDVATAEPLAVLPHAGIVWDVALSPNDRHALTGSTGGTAALWDLSTRPPVAKSLAHEGAVWTVAFSPDGHTAITADVKSGSIRLWETNTGTLVRTFQGHALGIQAVAVSQDGRYLISGSSDRTARLWKLATGESVGVPLQHQAPVRHVAFSPDGHSVYTGSEDHTARRWHVPTGMPIGPAFVHGRKVQVVAVHPESTMFATGSWDQTAGLWEAPGPRNGSPAQLARWAERVTGIRLDDSGVLRVLTAAAWQETGREER